MTDLGLPTSLGNSLNPGFLAKGVSAQFHSPAGSQAPRVASSSSSFVDSLGSILGKTLSGGLALASLGSSIGLPGASLGLSKLGDAAASTLLHGLVSSTSKPNADQSSIAGMTAAASQMMPRHPYQPQPAALPGANFSTSA
jgi:hypothetical protein